MDKDNKNSFENYEKRIEEEFENSTIFNSFEKAEKNKKAHKNNSYIKLLCALLCMVIIIGGSIFSVIKFWPVEDNTEATEETQASIALTESANVSLDKMQNAKKGSICNVSKIVIENETDKYTCLPYKQKESDDDGNETEEIYFKLSGIDKEIPINNDYVTAFYSSLFDVSAVSKLEDKWTEKDCGLDKPKIAVYVTMADGSEFNFKVGNKVATSDGYYYVSTSLKDGIYMAEGDVYETYSADFNSLVDLTLFDKIAQDDDNSDYFLNDQLAVYDSIEINGDNFDSVKLSYNESEDEVMAYFIDEPVRTYADEEKISSLLSPLSSGLSASGVYKVKPDSDDIKKYGLVNPYLEINYTINNEDYNIKLSKPGLIDGNYCACIVEGVPVVYMLLSESIPFIDWNMDSLRFNLLYLRNIESIKTFSVNYKGETYKYLLSFDEAEKDDDTTTSSSEEKLLTVVLNSKPIGDKNFKTAYQRLTMASVAKYLGKDVEINKSPDISFEIELQNGDVDVISYTKYNENYYLHKLNGIGDELIPTRTVELLIQNYEKLRKGEDVDSPNNQQ